MPRIQPVPNVATALGQSVLTLNKMGRAPASNRPSAMTPTTANAPSASVRAGWIFHALFCLALPSALTAQTAAPKPPPHPDSLIAISGRGMELASYMFAASRASDSISALHPAPDEVNMYFARREGAEWWVMFGHLTAGRDTFLLSWEARQLRVNSGSFLVRNFRPAQPQTGWHLGAARAIDNARRSFTTSAHPRRPYNVAVLPSDQQEWLVYVFPAQTRPDVWPLGGDARYRVSSDGRTIVDTRRLHSSILEFGRPVLQNGSELTVGVHSAVLDDVPEDTDVLWVMTREPSVPEMVVTDAFVYELYPNAAIRLVGRREEVLKR